MGVLGKRVALITMILSTSCFVENRGDDLGSARSALTSTLAAAWSFDETAGQTCIDSSGNGIGGVLGGTSAAETRDPTRTLGILGGGLYFDGNQTVSVPNSPALEPEHVTLEVWAYAAGSPGAYRYLLSKGGNGCCCSSYALYTGGGGGLHFYVTSNYYGFTLSPAVAPGQVWDGTWHHIAGTYDGVAVRLYVDGAEVGSGSTKSEPISYNMPSHNDLIVGAYETSSCSFRWVGGIDEVRVWNGALTSGDVARRARGEEIRVDSDGDGVSDAIENALVGNSTTLAVITTGITNFAATLQMGDIVFAGSTDATPAPHTVLVVPAGTLVPSGEMTLTAALTPSDREVVTVSGLVLPPGETKVVGVRASGMWACVRDTAQVASVTESLHCQTDSVACQTAVRCPLLGTGTATLVCPDGSRQFSCTTVQDGSGTALVAGLLHSEVQEFHDRDGDRVDDAGDACPDTTGHLDFQGCPTGVRGEVTLRQVDQAMSGLCADGSHMCKAPLPGVDLRLYPRPGPPPAASTYSTLFSSNTHLGACTTASDGACILGAPAAGSYTLLAHWRDPETGQIVLTARSVGAESFVTDLAVKVFQIIKLLRRDGTIQVR